MSYSIFFSVLLVLYCFIAKRHSDGKLAAISLRNDRKNRRNSRMKTDLARRKHQIHVVKKSNLQNFCIFWPFNNALMYRE